MMDKRRRHMVTAKQRKVVILGYFLLLVSFLGFYSIYLDSSNQTSHWFIWVLLMLIGGSILGWKNLQFTGKEQKELIALDLLFILNFYLFSFWQIEYGLNYLISGIVGAILIFFINRKYLLKTG